MAETQRGLPPVWNTVKAEISQNHPRTKASFHINPTSQLFTQRSFSSFFIWAFGKLTFYSQDFNPESTLSNILLCSRIRNKHPISLFLLEQVSFVSLLWSVYCTRVWQSTTTRRTRLDRCGGGGIWAEEEEEGRFMCQGGERHRRAHIKCDDWWSTVMATGSSYLLGLI